MDWNWGNLTNADAWKQSLANLLRKGEDVGQYIQEAPGKAGQAIIDAGQRQSALMNEAFDPTGKTLIRNPQAANQAATNLLEGPLGIAPVGMFIGPTATAWNPGNAFKAAQMEKAGKPAEEIWQATGTTRGLDNSLRQEIPDNKSFLMGGKTFQDTVLNRMKALEIDKPTVKDVMYHPELFEAYPHLGNIEIQFTKKGSSSKAEWWPTENIIRVNPDLPVDKANNSLLHELQHAIQKEEDWNTGASAYEILQKHIDKQKSINDEITKLNHELRYYANNPEFADKYQQLLEERNNLSKQYSYDPQADAIKEYKAYGGEAEARLTQGREKLNKEQRANTFPFAKGENALDINPEEALIRLDHNQPTITRKELLQQQVNKLK